MKKVIKNIPNIVTSIRLIMAVLAPITLLYNEYLLSLIFYLVGGISDALDGFLARKLNAYSEFGKKLDGLSDKLFALSIILHYYGKHLYDYPPFLRGTNSSNQYNKL